MTYTKFCPVCNDRILTIEQMEKNLPCDKCQEEHAKKFKERFEKLKEE
jgi:reverse gyrase